MELHDRHDMQLPTTRNPFGVRDVPEPFADDVREFAGKVVPSSGDPDPNASQWGMIRERERGGALEGAWVQPLEWRCGWACVAKGRRDAAIDRCSHLYLVRLESRARGSASSSTRTESTDTGLTDGSISGDRAHGTRHFRFLLLEMHALTAPTFASSRSPADQASSMPSGKELRRLGSSGRCSHLPNTPADELAVFAAADYSFG
jgi:hypothetical protein